MYITEGNRQEHNPRWPLIPKNFKILESVSRKSKKETKQTKYNFVTNFFFEERGNLRRMTEKLSMIALEQKN